MPGPTPHRFPLDRRLLRSGLAAALALSACGSGGPSGAPRGSVSFDTPASTSETASPSAPTGQTDTDWGRIWDSLPAGFPPIAGSTPSDEAAAGPASATLVVDGSFAQSIVTSLEASLTRAGYRTEGLSGPLEDGGYVLDTRGSPAGCKVQIAAGPLGGLTSVTILYGAACPHD
jgi:hypothetical protein